MHTYEQPDNLVAMIEDSIARYPDNPLFGTKDATGVYRWLSYRQVGERIDHLRAGLRQLGVAAGDAVGVICGNRTEWALAAFATFGLGARFIPMYEKELVQTWKYIINDGAIKVLLVATEEIAGRIEAFRHETPALEHLLVIDSNNAAGMSALEQRGAEQSVASIRPAPSDIAVLIYTSGTTGKPKGVLLSHGNFTSNFLAGRRCLPQLSQHSRSLSILPGRIPSVRPGSCTCSPPWAVPSALWKTSPPWWKTSFRCSPPCWWRCRGYSTRSTTGSWPRSRKSEA